MAAEHIDILIVGAGLSGISAAYHVQTQCPSKSYAILEGRDAIGGTWDLFRYPGVRSDSDMFTLGYRFRPWREGKTFADGPSIRQYIRDTAHEHRIDQHIRFQHHVRHAAWSSADARWTVTAECGPEKTLVYYTCSFLYMCSGYYDYAHGHTPAWPGVEQFQGQIIHPQQWPTTLDYAGKRIVVIGSGATAVTLIPALATQAAHVTMLQRSPTYVVALPSEDADAQRLQRMLPASLAFRLTRWRSIWLGMLFYLLARWRPEKTKQEIIQQAQAQLGQEYDVATHFTPTYKPWDQRLCVAPDGDLFAAIRSGHASVVTDQIESFTEQGILLHSGKTLPADIIVTATGLTMRLLCGINLVVDGQPIEIGQTLSYKGMMYSNIPNLASAMGYTNASWTLKCELIAGYVCRLINYMDRHGYRQCTPRRPSKPMAELPALSFNSGYVQRAVSSLPRQGARRPWRIDQNYLRDILHLRFGRIPDPALEFIRPGKTALR